VTGLADLGIARRGGATASPASVRDAALESPREYFRSYLQLRAARPSDLQWYFDQALPGFTRNPEVRLAVEELVDRLGVLVGFDAARPEGAEYGTWSSNGTHLLVWVLDMPMAVARLSRLALARDAAAQALGVPALDAVSCLVVLCGAVNQRLLDDTMMLRRVQDHVRVATADGLMTLGTAVERGGLSHDDVRCLLRPAGALVDPLIALADRASARRP
jgi:hypothetical protein